MLENVLQDLWARPGLVIFSTSNLCAFGCVRDATRCAINHNDFLKKKKKNKRNEKKKVIVLRNVTLLGAATLGVARIMTTRRVSIPVTLFLNGCLFLLIEL